MKEINIDYVIMDGVFYPFNTLETQMESSLDDTTWNIFSIYDDGDSLDLPQTIDVDYDFS